MALGKAANFLRVDYGACAEVLLRKLPDWLSKPVLQEVLALVAPYKKYFRTKIQVWEKNHCEARVRFRKSLLVRNSAMRAGALAAMGEMATGMVLLKNVSTRKYRLTLKELSFVQNYPVQGDCGVICSISPQEMGKIREMLQLRGRGMARLQAEITLADGKIAAVVRTFWKMEAWDAVES